MSQQVNAEIISIGTEILLGELTDTNSVFIARVLRDLGINLFYMTSVGDNATRIAEAIRIALSRAQVVITCGGLGPTIDDMTRQGVALATGRELVFHQSLLDQIAERFAGFKVQMTDNNRRQAYLPLGAAVIENPVGTAPSFIVEQGDGIVISLPGVPREMKYLMTERVIPYLRSRFQLGIIKAFILKAAGIGESALDEQIGPQLLEAHNPTVGLAAHSGQIDIRITAKAQTEAEADGMIEDVAAQIRDRVGYYIYGVQDERLEDVLVKLLRERDLTLVVVEAGIGAVVSQAIADAPNGQDVLASVHYAASPQALAAMFNIPEGTSLRALAAKSAELACQQSGAYAAITIVAFPDQAEGADSSEGSAMAVYTSKKSNERVYGFGAQADVARQFMTTWSLAQVWRIVRESVDVS